MKKTVPLPRWPASLSHRYHPTRILGSGGRSTVVEARDHSGMDVAIKLPFVPNGTASEASLRKLLVHEAGPLSVISDVGVVKLLDYNHQGEFMICERLVEEPMSLRYALKRPSYRRALEIAADLAVALSCIHAAGYLHLDLKPNNVLYRQGRVERSVIIDFGSTRPITKQVADSTIKSTNLGSGRYLFKAPEQLMPLTANFGPETDSFALGGTLYWLVFGVAPFSNMSPERQQALNNYEVEESRAIQAVVDLSTGHRLRTLITKLLCLEMSQRPSDLKAVAEMLYSCI